LWQLFQRVSFYSKPKKKKKLTGKIRNKSIWMKKIEEKK
jgi:hypothetical protein